MNLKPFPAHGGETRPINWTSVPTPIEHNFLGVHSGPRRRPAPGAMCRRGLVHIARVDDATATYGPVDVLINDAALNDYMPIRTMSHSSLLLATEPPSLPSRAG